jgi:nucleotide-binding universal stress UspA family protein
MYRKILVPYDGSQFSERAVEHAVYLAKALDAELVFVNATVLPALIYTYHEATNVAINEAAQLLVESSKDAATRSLEGIEGRCKKEGIRASYMHRVGDPAELILDTAKKEKADLIVMGSRGLGAVKSLFLGSVTRKVSERSTCPVLIVHQ